MGEEIESVTFVKAGLSEKLEWVLPGNGLVVGSSNQHSYYDFPDGGTDGDSYNPVEETQDTSMTSEWLAQTGATSACFKNKNTD